MMMMNKIIDNWVYKLAFCFLFCTFVQDGKCMTRDDDGRLTRYRRSNNGDGGVEKFVELSQQRPKLVTKFARIISYERQTVVLPCEILNLPVDMHVIWQYGKRGESNQTVLTVGGTQVESNYRIRIITNASNEENYLEMASQSDVAHSAAQANEASSNKDESNPQRLTVNNLEIRKLHLSDSGWYECQLPTKPTQINYIYLEVLGLPKIETTNRQPVEGESIELTCQVRNLPKRHELTWYINDRKLNTKLIAKQHQQQQTTVPQEKPAQNDLINYMVIKRNNRGLSNGVHLHRQQHHVKLHELNESFMIINERLHNLTVSRLRIKHLTHLHKGVYKCKYDSVETSYNLDFKSSLKSRSHMYDQLYSLNSSNDSRVKYYSLLFAHWILFFYLNF